MTIFILTHSLLLRRRVETKIIFCFARKWLTKIYDFLKLRKNEKCCSPLLKNLAWKNFVKIPSTVVKMEKKAFSFQHTYYTARPNTENSKQIFPGKKQLRGYSPNSNIHVSVRDLYMIGPNVGIYRSLTDAWMWKLGLRTRAIPFLGIYNSNFFAVYISAIYFHIFSLHY